jgi:hypothetical protein
MSDRIEIFELIERLDAASRDETLVDGMLYRAAAERLAEYISRDVKYWHNIMSRTDKQADRIIELATANTLLIAENKGWAERFVRIKALPDKWRRISAFTYSEGMFQGPGMTGDSCANELQAALEQGDDQG